MNRRSMIGSIIGACAAILLPWRKAKANSWAYVTIWEMGKDVQYELAGQAPRIKKLLTKASQRQQSLRAGDIEVVSYVMTVLYAVHQQPFGNVTSIRWQSKVNHAIVHVFDADAESMDDNKLSHQLTQAFLRSLQEKDSVWIKTEKTMENTG